MTATVPFFTELHFHLLPGLDDGPTTLEESVELAAAAAAEGTRAVVATPHVNRDHLPDVAMLPEVVAQVRDRLRRSRIPLQVHCGGELAHDRVEGLSQAELELIAHGPKGARWVLLEAPMPSIDRGFALAAEELRARGFAVVVAHPERSLRDREFGWQVLARELAAGSAMQVNAWSLAGLYGDRIRREAFGVLRRAPRAVVASDAHGPARMPALRMALDALRRAGDPRPEQRMSELPVALLRDGLALPVVAAA